MKVNELKMGQIVKSTLAHHLTHHLTHHHKGKI